MQQVFLGIARSWDERPLTVEEARRKESGLVPAVYRLVTGINDGCTDDEMLHLLNAVVSAYLAARE